MPYFALTYEVVDGFADKRLPFRPQHLQLARDAAARGELVMAGALGEPVGALLVFRTADRRTVARAESERLRALLDVARAQNMFGGPK